MRQDGFSIALLVGLLTLMHSGITAAESPMRFTGPWEVQRLAETEVAVQWGEKTGAVQSLLYEGEPYQGQATQVFAYYACPEGDGPFPAMLLVHGGGGKAFSQWAEHWAERGYAALAMDLSGNGPDGRLENGGPDQSDGTKFRTFGDDEVRDMWTYHAVAAVLRGYNVLASRPEVDEQRIGVTGISWGGYLTCIIAGIDHRLKVAVPVYGCGFLDRNSVWLEPRFNQMDDEQRRRWVEYFDPSRYLPGVSCPILFVNGTNDFAYPLDSYQQSYELVKAPRNLSIRVALPHGHIWTFEEVDAFVGSVLRESQPLARLSEPRLERESDGGTLISAQVEGSVVVKQAQLHYTSDLGPWQERRWTSIEAQMKDGAISASLPRERPLVCFLTVTDERQLTVSSPHVELAAKPVKYEWELVTMKAEFAPRDGAGALSFGGKMWLLGGWNPIAAYREFFPRICNNEVWSSPDGASWTLVRANTFHDDTFDPLADWEGRHTAGYVVHQEKLWIIGGDANQKHYQNDVWNSSDGAKWELVNSQVPWAPRALHYTVAHNGKIWVLGGQTMPAFGGGEERFYRDVWTTEDGREWQQLQPVEPYWSPRGMIGGSAVHRGRIYVLGGGTYDTPTTPTRQFMNDVWSSADGVRWHRHTDAAAWAPRQYHEVAVWDDRLWVMEGYHPGGNRNDVWHSADGVNWEEVSDTPWKPRHAASVFVHDGALWMVAGNNMESDVWKLRRVPWASMPADGAST